jgi:hypothetical protein
MSGAVKPAPNREESDVNIRGVLAFAVGLVVVGLTIHGLIWLLFVYFNGRETARSTHPYPLAVAQESRLPPEPRLQTNPRQDLQDLLAKEDEILNGYQWVDKDAGIVRIPIAEAMRLTVERGLPSRKAGAR